MAKFNSTVVFGRKDASRKRLPPRHERPNYGITPLLPESTDEANEEAYLRIPAHSVPSEAFNGKVRLDVPTEPVFDRVWRSLSGVSVSWFNRDASYLTLAYDLSAEFRNEFRPSRETLRFFVCRGDEKAVLQQKTVRVEGRTMYVSLEFDARCVDWLEADASIVRITVERRVAKKWKRRSFIPKRAAPVRLF